ncbi:CPBP family intramembrane glutamic endopeptidase [Streptomyces nanshensis]|uniref:Peptidase n=1 Tax=Streptomyces nanshensis TaxID=518642 RepID=A0A1E7KY86_9ACTN|nr:type II CAAX endopeptidase family protein [Streptomyces nanshensis]OEV08886.1 peptidase [Streptomyces nanshensis]
MPTSSASPAPVPGRYRNDLTLFLGIAFATSWLAWGVAVAVGGESTEPPANLSYTLGAFGPLIGALVIRIRRRRRGEAVPRHVVAFRRRHLLWAPVLMILGSATVVLAALFGYAAGGPALSLDSAREMAETMGGPVAFLGGMLVSGPLSEEAGWRGTAYPRLRATMSRFQVGLLLGVVWAVWHLPLFFIDGTPQHELGLASASGVLFAVSNVPMAMLVAAAYDRAGIVAAIGMHFAVNVSLVSLGVTAPETQAMLIGIQSIAVVLVLATGRGTGRPSPRTAVPETAYVPESTART